MMFFSFLVVGVGMSRSGPQDWDRCPTQEMRQEEIAKNTPDKRCMISYSDQDVFSNTPTTAPQVRETRRVTHAATSNTGTQRLTKSAPPSAKKVNRRKFPNYDSSPDTAYSCDSYTCNEHSDSDTSSSDTVVGCESESSDEENPTGTETDEPVVITIDDQSDNETLTENEGVSLVRESVNRSTSQNEGISSISSEKQSKTKASCSDSLKSFKTTTLSETQAGECSMKTGRSPYIHRLPSIGEKGSQEEELQEIYVSDKRHYPSKTPPAKSPGIGEQAKKKTTALSETQAGECSMLTGRSLCIQSSLSIGEKQSQEEELPDISAGDKRQHSPPEPPPAKRPRIEEQARTNDQEDEKNFIQQCTTHCVLNRDAYESRKFRKVCQGCRNACKRKIDFFPLPSSPVSCKNRKAELNSSDEELRETMDLQQPMLHEESKASETVPIKSETVDLDLAWASSSDTSSDKDDVPKRVLAPKRRKIMRHKRLRGNKKKFVLPELPFSNFLTQEQRDNASWSTCGNPINSKCFLKKDSSGRKVCKPSSANGRLPLTQEVAITTIYSEMVQEEICDTSKTLAHDNGICDKEVISEDCVEIVAVSNTGKRNEQFAARDVEISCLGQEPVCPVERSTSTENVAPKTDVEVDPIEIILDAQHEPPSKTCLSRHASHGSPVAGGNNSGKRLSKLCSAATPPKDQETMFPRPTSSQSLVNIAAENLMVPDSPRGMTLRISDAKSFKEFVASGTLSDSCGGESCVDRESPIRDELCQKNLETGAVYIKDVDTQSLLSIQVSPSGEMQNQGKEITPQSELSQPRSTLTCSLPTVQGSPTAETQNQGKEITPQSELSQPQSTVTCCLPMCQESPEAETQNQGKETTPRRELSLLQATLACSLPMVQESPTAETQNQGKETTPQSELFQPQTTLACSLSMVQEYPIAETQNQGKETTSQSELSQPQHVVSCFLGDREPALHIDKSSEQLSETTTYPVMESGPSHDSSKIQEPLLAQEPSAGPGVSFSGEASELATEPVRPSGVLDNSFTVPVETASQGSDDESIIINAVKPVHHTEGKANCEMGINSPNESPQSNKGTCTQVTGTVNRNNSHPSECTIDVSMQVNKTVDNTNSLPSKFTSDTCMQVEKTDNNTNSLPSKFTSDTCMQVEKTDNNTNSLLSECTSDVSMQVNKIANNTNSLPSKFTSDTCMQVDKTDNNTNSLPSECTSDVSMQVNKTVNNTNSLLSECTSDTCMQVDKLVNNDSSLLSGCGSHLERIDMGDHPSQQLCDGATCVEENSERTDKDNLPSSQQWCDGALCVEELDQHGESSEENGGKSLGERTDMDSPPTQQCCDGATSVEEHSERTDEDNLPSSQQWCDGATCVELHSERTDEDNLDFKQRCDGATCVKEFDQHSETSEETDAKSLGGCSSETTALLEETTRLLSDLCGDILEEQSGAVSAALQDASSNSGCGSDVCASQAPAEDTSFIFDNVCKEQENCVSELQSGGVSAGLHDGDSNSISGSDKCTTLSPAMDTPILFDRVCKQENDVSLDIHDRETSYIPGPVSLAQDTIDLCDSESDQHEISTDVQEVEARNISDSVTPAQGIIDFCDSVCKDHKCEISTVVQKREASNISGSVASAEDTIDLCGSACKDHNCEISTVVQKREASNISGSGAPVEVSMDLCDKVCKDHKWEISTTDIQETGANNISDSVAPVEDTIDLCDLSECEELDNDMETDVQGTEKRSISGYAMCDFAATERNSVISMDVHVRDEKSGVAASTSKPLAPGEETTEVSSHSRGMVSDEKDSDISGDGHGGASDTVAPAGDINEMLLDFCNVSPEKLDGEFHQESHKGERSFISRSEKCETDACVTNDKDSEISSYVSSGGSETAPLAGNISKMLLDFCNVSPDKLDNAIHMEVHNNEESCVSISDEWVTKVPATKFTLPFSETCEKSSEGEDSQIPWHLHEAEESCLSCLAESEIEATIEENTVSELSETASNEQDSGILLEAHEKENDISSDGNIVMSASESAIIKNVLSDMFDGKLCPGLDGNAHVNAFEDQERPFHNRITKSRPSNIPGSSKLPMDITHDQSGGDIPKNSSIGGVEDSQGNLECMSPKIVCEEKSIETCNIQNSTHSMEKLISRHDRVVQDSSQNVQNVNQQDMPGKVPDRNCQVDLCDARDLQQKVVNQRVPPTSEGLPEISSLLNVQQCPENRAILPRPEKVLNGSCHTEDSLRNLDKSGPQHLYVEKMASQTRSKDEMAHICSVQDSKHGLESSSPQLRSDEEIADLCHNQDSQCKPERPCSQTRSEEELADLCNDQDSQHRIKGSSNMQHSQCDLAKCSPQSVSEELPQFSHVLDSPLHIEKHSSEATGRFEENVDADRQNSPRRFAGTSRLSMTTGPAPGNSDVSKGLGCVDLTASGSSVHKENHDASCKVAPDLDFDLSCRETLEPLQGDAEENLHSVRSTSRVHQQEQRGHTESNSLKSVEDTQDSEESSVPNDLQANLELVMDHLQKISNQYEEPDQNHDPGQEPKGTPSGRQGNFNDDSCIVQTQVNVNSSVDLAVVTSECGSQRIYEPSIAEDMDECGDKVMQGDVRKSNDLCAKEPADGAAQMRDAAKALLHEKWFREVVSQGVREHLEKCLSSPTLKAWAASQQLDVTPDRVYEGQVTAPSDSEGVGKDGSSSSRAASWSSDEVAEMESEGSVHDEHNEPVNTNESSARTPQRTSSSKYTASTSILGTPPSRIRSPIPTVRLVRNDAVYETKRKISPPLKSTVGNCTQRGFKKQQECSSASRCYGNNFEGMPVLARESYTTPSKDSPESPSTQSDETEWTNICRKEKKCTPISKMWAEVSDILGQTLKSPTCSWCRKSFRSQRLLEEHQKHHCPVSERVTPPASAFVCQICGKNCSEASQLADHMEKRHHRKDRPLCWEKVGESAARESMCSETRNLTPTNPEASLQRKENHKKGRGRLRKYGCESESRPDTSAEVVSDSEILSQNLTRSSGKTLRHRRWAKDLESSDEERDDDQSKQKDSCDGKSEGNSGYLYSLDPGCGSRRLVARFRKMMEPVPLGRPRGEAKTGSEAQRQSQREEARSIGDTPSSLAGPHPNLRRTLFSPAEPVEAEVVQRKRKRKGSVPGDERKNPNESISQVSKELFFS